MIVLPVVVPTLFGDLQSIVFSAHANVKLHNMYKDIIITSATDTGMDPAIRS